MKDKLDPQTLLGKRCRLSVNGVAREWFGVVEERQPGLMGDGPKTMSRLYFVFEIPGRWPIPVSEILDDETLTLEECGR